MDDLKKLLLEKIQNENMFTVPEICYNGLRWYPDHQIRAIVKQLEYNGIIKRIGKHHDNRTILWRKTNDKEKLETKIRREIECEMIQKSISGICALKMKLED